jgi:hypothetical protein
MSDLVVLTKFSMGKRCEEGVVILPYVLSRIGCKVVRSKLVRYPFFLNFTLPHRVLEESQ